MIGRSVGVVAAASAMAANALLIPPEIQSMDTSLDASSVINHNWQTVKLPCGDCLFLKPKSEVEDLAEGGQPVWIQGGAESILLNVSTIFQGNAVGLKDYPLYPPLMSFQKASADIVASATPMKDIYEGKAHGVSVEITADEKLAETTEARDGGSVIRVDYTILSINGQPVTVDTVVVTALKDPDTGKLSLLNVAPQPKSHGIFDAPPPPPPAPGHGGPEAPKKPAKCDLPPMLCHMREIALAKLEELKTSLPKHFGGKGGCQGKRPFRHGRPGQLASHIRPFDKDGRPIGHHGKPSKHPGHHGPGQGFHGHHHHHGFHFTRLLRALVFVLVPILLGMTVGILVSCIGLVVGRLVVFLWQTFVRSGQRGYAQVHLDEEDAEKDEVESVVSEPLPRYSEEAPAYEEKQSA